VLLDNPTAHKLSIQLSLVSNRSNEVSHSPLVGDMPQVYNQLPVPQSLGVQFKILESFLCLKRWQLKKVELQELGNLVFRFHHAYFNQ